jgi:hypothetical protein
MQRVLFGFYQIGLNNQHDAPEYQRNAMYVHAIILLIIDTCEVSLPESPDHKQEEQYKINIASLVNRSLKTHLVKDNSGADLTGEKFLMRQKAFKFS